MAKKLEIKAVLKAVDRATGPMRLAAKRIKMALGGVIHGVGRGFGGLGSIIGGVTSRLAALAGVAGVGGLVAWTKSFVGAGSELAKFARQVGISTDRLQELEYTAGLLDTSVPELRGSFSVLARNMGAAKNKTGELYSELKKTDRGLLKQLRSTTDTGKAFDLLIAAISASPDAMQRARLAQVAFGRSGAKMIRFAEQGHIGLAKMADEARKSGAIMGGPMLKQTEDFNDEIHRTQMAFKGLGVTVMRQLLPVFSPLMKRMSEWLRSGENQKKVASWFKEVVTTIVEGLPKVVSWLEETGEEVAGFIEKIGGLKTVGIALALVMSKDLVTAVSALGKALIFSPIGALVAAIAGLAYLLTGSWEGVAKFFGDMWDGIVRFFEKAWETIKPIIDAIRDAISWVKEQLAAEDVFNIVGNVTKSTVAATEAVKKGDSGSAAFTSEMKPFIEEYAAKKNGSAVNTQEIKGEIGFWFHDPGGVVDKTSTRANGVVNIKSQGARKSSVGK